MNPKLAAFLMSMLLVLPMILDVGPAAAKDHKALSNYIQTELNGNISAAAYPEGGQGRIVELP